MKQELNASQQQVLSRRLLEWVYNEGEGREVWPTDLCGDPNPYFDLLRQLLSAPPQEQKTGGAEVNHECSICRRRHGNEIQHPCE